jgi:DNA-binding NarL/FixJ family response regulator
MALRIVVVASHPVIHGIVRLACEGVDGSIVAEASTAKDALEILAREDAELLVLDLDLPDANGITVLKRMRSSSEQAAAQRRILVISEREDTGTILEAMRLGATGYLTKADGLRGLTTAIRRVSNGDQVLRPDLERRLIEQITRYASNAREGAKADELLTERERIVLAHLADGLTLKQIGRRLGISPRTVESHVGKLYRKLGVSTRMQAVSRAATLGLIEL